MKHPGKAVSSAAGHPLGELALIDLIRQRAGKASNREIRLGIGDDCAILHPRTGEEIVVTTDLCLEGRHFRREWHSPASIGHRTLARGLSDLAAMGARPIAAFLSLALPKAVAAEPTWLNGFLDGLLTLAARAKVSLAGGDTSQAPGSEILADIVLLGAVPTGRALRRSGARAGDRLFCTGTLGGAAAELRLLQTNVPPNPAKLKSTAPKSTAPKAITKSLAENPHPQLFPEPRLRPGMALVRRGLATAAMDLSDGLSTDLGHLCEASHLAASIHLPDLPMHPLAVAFGPATSLNLALHGGEDYELLFAADPGQRIPSTLAGVRVTEIGNLMKQRPGQPRITAVAADGTQSELLSGGWEHLR